MPKNSPLKFPECLKIFQIASVSMLPLLTSAIKGVQVSGIVIKTGTVPNAQSNCSAVMEICDKDRHCCQTTPNGKGLDHPGKDRGSGQTDIYTNTAILGNCAEVIGEACRICFWFKGQTASPKRMKLRKSSKRPLTPPPHLWKIILRISLQKCVCSLWRDCCVLYDPIYHEMHVVQQFNMVIG